MAVAGAGAEIIDKGGAGAEIDNFGFAKLKNFHKHCFGSIFIESGSCQKSESGPDPDPSYFFTLSEIFFSRYFIISRFSHQKKSIER